MKPYYEDDFATIYHGDCREVLPSLEWDVVVTDPPYGTSHYVTDTTDFTPDLLRQLAAQPCAVFGWPERLAALCVDAGLKPDEWVTWWPTNGALRGFAPNGLARESEHVAVFGVCDWRRLRRPPSAESSAIVAGGYTSGRPGLAPMAEGGAQLGDVWTDAAPGLGFNFAKRHHPNEKPLRVLVRLVDAMPPGCVLDPFCGSGTTLRSAKDLGRRSIGIEIEEGYCYIAAKRLNQEVLNFGGAA